MKDYIHRICPCHSYDIEGIQTWLEDMAKDGLILEKDGHGLGMFTFQRGKPIRCRYRLEVLFEGKRSYDDRQAYLDLIRECGWIRITDYQGFDIFCTEDPNARELSTDPQIQALTLRKLKWERVSRIAVLIFQTLLLTVNRQLGWFYLFRNAATFGPLPTGLMLSFLALCLFIPLVNLIQIHKLEKKLRSGELLNRRKEWRSRAMPNYICKIIPVILCVAVIVSWLSGLLMASNQQELTSHPSDPPFITVEDLADSDYQLQKPPLSGNNHYVFWNNTISPVNYEWREYASFVSGGETNTGYLIVEYHETTSEWFARGLADDYYIYETTRDRDNQDLEAPDFGLDEVRVFGSYGNYDVLIRHGTIVIHTSYSQWNDGAVPDWQIWLEAMAQKLLTT